MQPIYPDFIDFHCDGNGTCEFADSTKTVNPILSEIAAEMIYRWDGWVEESYKSYVERVLHPGGKYDERVRHARAEPINHFLKFLKETNHPMYQAAHDRYQEIAPPYLDAEGNATFRLFPSVLNLIERMKQVAKVNLILRTFGPDGPSIAKQYAAHGLAMERKAFFNQERVEVDGRRVAFGPELLEALEGQPICGKDHVDAWKESGLSIHGKWIPCVADAQFKGAIRVAIIADDNLKKKETVTNIAHPVDVYQRPVSWDSRGVIQIRVNTMKASLDPDYMIRKVNKEFARRGFSLL